MKKLISVLLLLRKEIDRVFVIIKISKFLYLCDMRLLKR